MEELLRINLLDWREYRREERRKRFFRLLFLVIAASVLTIVAIRMIYFGQRIQQQKSRNQYLQDQITQAQKQVKELREIKDVRSSLIKRMKIIDDLQQSRTYIVHYFDQIVDTIPDGVFLKSLKLSDHTTTLEGAAESNARVSSYMVQLNNSDYLSDPRLIVIQRDKNSNLVNFTLMVDSAQATQDTSESSKASHE